MSSTTGVPGMTRAWEAMEFPGLRSDGDGFHVSVCLTRCPVCMSVLPTCSRPLLFT